MDIAEVAKRSGVPASALRYYETRGLIRSIGRVGARRSFAPDVLERLAFIALGRAAGLLLDEIGRMLPTDGKLRIDRDMLATRADHLDARIRQLTTMRDGLRHAAACQAADHLVCPRFQRLLHAAATRGERKRGRFALSGSETGGHTTTKRHAE